METSHSDINPNVPSAVADPEKAETPSPMLTKEGPDPSSEGEQSADTTTPAKGRTIIGVRWFFVCLGIFSANLLYGLDTTIAADIQAAVSETYDNVTQLGWLGIGFGLGSTVAILPLGKMYGVFDNKWLYLSCLLMFSAGSALCGAAPSMNALIIGRVWAGAGGAGMYLGTLNIVTTMTTPREQAFYVGFQGFVYGGGCILGPIVGGLLADSPATWRWAFYLNLVIFGAMGPAYLFALPSLPRQTELSWTEKLRKLDWLGTVLTAGMYTFFIVPLTSAGAIWAWSDTRFIVLMVLSVVFTAAFVVTQYYAVFTNKLDRLFPGEFLRNPQLVLLYMSMAAGGAALFVAVYYIPLYFLFVHGESGTQAAVRLLPFVVFYVTSILVCGYLMPTTGYHWAWYLASGLLLTAGGAAMYVVDRETQVGYVYGVSLLLGFGLTVSQAGYALAPYLVPVDRVPEVIEFLDMAQGQSQMLGLAIASPIFQNKAFQGVQRVLGGLGYSDADIQGALAGSQSAVLEEVSPEVRAQVLDVLVEAIKAEWILVIAAGSLLTVCACFLTKKRFY